MAMYIVLRLINIITVILFPADNSEEYFADNNEDKDSNILRKYPFLIFFLTACVLLYIAHNIFFVELPAMAAIVKIAKKISIEKVILVSSIS